VALIRACQSVALTTYTARPSQPRSKPVTEKSAVAPESQTESASPDSMSSFIPFFAVIA